MSTLAIARASLGDCLDFAGMWPVMRRNLVRVHEAGEAYILREMDEQGGYGPVLALAALSPDGEGRNEFNLGIRPHARVHMRELCRTAHLILTRLAQDRPIICYVVPGNRSGERMARIVGFRPDPNHKYRWIMGVENVDYQGTVRRRQRQGAAAGKPAARRGQ